MRGDRPYTRVKGTGWKRDERRVEDGKGGKGERERERETKRGSNERRVDDGASGNGKREEPRWWRW